MPRSVRNGPLVVNTKNRPLYELNHTKLTYRFSWRDIRLTDVYGEVIHHVIS